MANPIKVLIQTTIPFTEDGWNIGRFSLLHDYLAALRGGDGHPLFEIIARDRDPMDFHCCRWRGCLGRAKSRHIRTSCQFQIRDLVVLA